MSPFFGNQWAEQIGMGPEKVPESAGLGGADLAVLGATVQAIDTVTASLGYCAPLEPT